MGNISKRQQRRKNRNFKSLEQSSRKHRRAYKRLGEACTINGQFHKSGSKIEVRPSGLVHTAGGAIKFW